MTLPWQANRTALAGQLCVTVAMGLAPVAAAWLLRSVFDVLADRRAGDLPWLVAALAVAAGVQGVIPTLGQYLAAQSGRAVERLTTTELFGVVGRLTGLRRLEDPVFLDRLNAAQRTSKAGPGQVIASLSGLIQAALTMTGFLVALLVISPVMAAVVLGAALPWIAAEASVARRRAAMLIGISHAERRQYFYASLLSSLAAAKEIRLFGLGLFFRKRMLDELCLIQRAGQRVDRREAVLYGLLATLSALVAGAGIWWAGAAALRGQLTIGDVSLFVTALQAVSGALGVMAANAGLAYQAVLTFRSYCDIVAEGPDLALPAQPVPACPLRQGIEFRDVWFRYGPDLPWTLRGVSFSIPYGQAVALVGRNGAGKSTVVKLICRFYDPDLGQVLWDGVDLRDLDLDTLRSRVSAVFQDYMAYELSVADNIAVGDIGLRDQPDALARAARRAGIHDVLSTLPGGYDTPLTRIYVDLDDKQDPRTGVLLSGGQWQRVALARAYLRGHRDLVILDEPSSGLDAEAEHEIHTGLHAHRRGRTSVLISHRLNTVRGADRIIVLADGAVAEQGSHHDLMSIGGIYARLFSLQAKGFADQLAAGAVMNGTRWEDG